tara:strand:- start:469 stop:570 length:102 start_codon:yes stop_codon:yes gene_type:complete
VQAHGFSATSSVAIALILQVVAMALLELRGEVC